MTPLLPEHVEALQSLKEICDDLQTELVVIGAVAYRFWMTDATVTEDLDCAVALDIDDVPRLTERLEQLDWKKSERKEERWVTPQRAFVDLLPAGPKSRRQGQLVWPVSDMTMSLVGFGAAFADSREIAITQELKVRVASPASLALMKIGAYLQAPYERTKDVSHLFVLLRDYEDGDRRFSDVIYEYDIPYDSAGAFLLGLDVVALCRYEHELAALRKFGEILSDEDSTLSSTMSRLVGHDNEGELGRLRHRVTAFRQGCTAKRQG